MSDVRRLGLGGIGCADLGKVADAQPMKVKPDAGENLFCSPGCLFHGHGMLNGRGCHTHRHMAGKATTGHWEPVILPSSTVRRFTYCLLLSLVAFHCWVPKLACNIQGTEGGA